MAERRDDATRDERGVGRVSVGRNGCGGHGIEGVVVVVAGSPFVPC